MKVSPEAIQQQKIRLWSQRLIEEYRQLQFTYNLKIRIPVIRIESSSSRWGNWDPETRTLSIAQRLIENQPWEIVLEIFKHEIAHQIVTELSQDKDIHGPAFKAACQRIGVAEWASKAETNLLPLGSVLRVTDTSPTEKRLLERAEKLLSLATSDNEHEALLAMQKVQELYSKYNLERIQKQEGGSWGYLLLKLKKKRVERYQSVIASLLNDHFFVEVIHTSIYDAEACEEFKALELIGTRENVLMAEYVFWFLMNQLQGLWESYRKGQNLSVASRNSYFLGVLSGFREKLEASAKAITHTLMPEGTSSLALTLREDAGLQSYLSVRYPKLNRLKGSRRLHDNQAFSAGQKEGRSLVLHKGLSRTDGNLKKLLR